MSDPRWLGVVAIGAWLVLVIAGLARRRLPRATLWRYAAMWAAIFGLLFAGALLLGGQL